MRKGERIGSRSARIDLLRSEAKNQGQSGGVCLPLEQGVKS